MSCVDFSTAYRGRNLRHLTPVWCLTFHKFVYLHFDVRMLAEAYTLYVCYGGPVTRTCLRVK